MRRNPAVLIITESRGARAVEKSIPKLCIESLPGYGELNPTRRPGALLDAQILADVYLNLTGGQVKLELSSEHKEVENNISTDTDIKFNVKKFTAKGEDLSSHQKILLAMSEKSGEKINW